ncbi:GIY-YIG nuclease family protein [Nonomuraea zeae]|uniref:GIY-YIG nuclease family protein n=1 Tax=Nonomuraea zeae TaxID=1642303 RepID=A0A5S4H2V5_9ACTN|nr:GIY-YIG nuclease family protein [Nonomuraea zeae]TMR39583.1 GIY-YIG nuclease family protein [Nonomuraea zeae]
MNEPMSSSERRAYNQRLFRWQRYEAALAGAGNPQSWVYVIGCDEVRLVKIGISSNLQTRLAAMQIGSPVILRLLWAIPGSIDVELDLHECFREYRKHGEWFDFGDENPVAMVAGAAVLLGHWRPHGLAEVSPRHVSSEAFSEPELESVDEEIPRVILPDSLDAPTTQVAPPPLPPGPRRAEETP